jgi:hypothetical protein
VITGTLTVRQLASDQTVVLRGLSVIRADSDHGLLVEDCAGPVWVEDCTFLEPYLTQEPSHGMVLRDSAFVNIERTYSEGSRAQGAATVGGLGLQVVDSDVALFDSELHGGLGLAALGLMLDAGAGAHVDGGSLFVSGGSLSGGDGGNGFGPFGCADGGDGGTGLVLSGSAPLVRVVGASIAGGAAGVTRGGCTPGTAGADTSVLAGNLDWTPWIARSLHIDSPLRSGESLDATLQGSPGDFVWVLLSPTYAPLVLPKQPGSPVVGGPFLPDLGPGRFIVLGSLDPTGSLQLSLPVPPIPVTFTRYLQALMFSTGPAGEIVLSGGTELTFVEDGI